MKLLIDIGNSRLKSALLSDGRLSEFEAVEHGEIAFDALWKNIHGVDSVWIASVAGDTANESVAAAIFSRFQVAPHFVHSSAEAFGVRSAYAQPERLGIDRFLAMIAAHRRVGALSVIASCGTALTLDAVDASGQHLGGLIAPSPTLMQSSLRARAARLQSAREVDVVEFADNTDAAVTSGAWLAAVALIERFVARTEKHAGTRARLLLTGGGASQLAALLSVSPEVEPNLVLDGLAAFADASV